MKNLHSSRTLFAWLALLVAFVAGSGTSWADTPTHGHAYKIKTYDYSADVSSYYLYDSGSALATSTTDQGNAGIWVYVTHGSYSALVNYSTGHYLSWKAVSNSWAPFILKSEANSGSGGYGLMFSAKVNGDGSSRDLWLLVDTSTGGFDQAPSGWTASGYASDMIFTDETSSVDADQLASLLAATAQTVSFVDADGNAISPTVSGATGSTYTITAGSTSSPSLTLPAGYYAYNAYTYTGTANSKTTTITGARANTGGWIDACSSLPSSTVTVTVSPRFTPGATVTATDGTNVQDGGYYRIKLPGRSGQTLYATTSDKKIRLRTATATTDEVWKVGVTANGITLQSVLTGKYVAYTSSYADANSLDMLAADVSGAETWYPLLFNESGYTTRFALRTTSGGDSYNYFGNNGGASYPMGYYKGQDNWANWGDTPDGGDWFQFEPAEYTAPVMPESGNFYTLQGYVSSGYADRDTKNAYVYNNSGLAISPTGGTPLQNTWLVVSSGNENYPVQFRSAVDGQYISWNGLSSTAEYNYRADVAAVTAGCIGIWEPTYQPSGNAGRYIASGYKSDNSSYAFANAISGATGYYAETTKQATNWSTEFNLLPVSDYAAYTVTFNGVPAGETATLAYTQNGFNWTGVESGGIFVAPVAGVAEADLTLPDFTNYIKTVTIDNTARTVTVAYELNGFMVDVVGGSAVAGGGVVYNESNYTNGQLVPQRGLTADDFTAIAVEGYKGVVTVDGTTVSVKYIYNTTTLPAKNASATPLFTITSADASRGYLHAKDGYLSGSAKTSTTVDVSDDNFRFAFVRGNLGNYMYSVGAAAFVTLGSENNFPLTAAVPVPAGEATYPLLTFGASTNANAASYPITLDLVPTTINLTADQGNGAVKYGNHPGDDGNSMQLVTVGTADLSSVYTAVNDAELAYINALLSTAGTVGHPKLTATSYTNLVALRDAIADGTASTDATANRAIVAAYNNEVSPNLVEQLTDANGDAVTAGTLYRLSLPGRVAYAEAQSRSETSADLYAKWESTADQVGISWNSLVMPESFWTVEFIDEGNPAPTKIRLKNNATGKYIAQATATQQANAANATTSDAAEAEVYEFFSQASPTGSNAGWALKPTDRDTYLSNNSGFTNDMGYWTGKNDDGTVIRFTPANIPADITQLTVTFQDTEGSAVSVSVNDGEAASTYTYHYRYTDVPTTFATSSPFTTYTIGANKYYGTAINVQQPLVGVSANTIVTVDVAAAGDITLTDVTGAPLSPTGKYMLYNVGKGKYAWVCNEGDAFNYDYLYPYDGHWAQNYAYQVEGTGSLVTIKSVYNQQYLVATDYSNGSKKVAAKAATPLEATTLHGVTGNGDNGWALTPNDVNYFNFYDNVYLGFYAGDATGQDQAWRFIPAVITAFKDADGNDVSLSGTVGGEAFSGRVDVCYQQNATWTAISHTEASGYVTQYTINGVNYLATNQEALLAALNAITGSDATVIVTSVLRPVVSSTDQSEITASRTYALKTVTGKYLYETAAHGVDYRTEILDDYGRWKLTEQANHEFLITNVGSGRTLAFFNFDTAPTTEENGTHTMDLRNTDYLGTYTDGYTITCWNDDRTDRGTLSSESSHSYNDVIADGANVFYIERAANVPPLTLTFQDAEGNPVLVSVNGKEAAATYQYIYESDDTPATFATATPSAYAAYKIGSTTYYSSAAMTKLYNFAALQSDLTITVTPQAADIAVLDSNGDPLENGQTYLFKNYGVGASNVHVNAEGATLQGTSSYSDNSYLFEFNGAGSLVGLKSVGTGQYVGATAIENGTDKVVANVAETAMLTMLATEIDATNHAYKLTAANDGTEFNLNPFGGAGNTLGFWHNTSDGCTWQFVPAIEVVFKESGTGSVIKTLALPKGQTLTSIFFDDEPARTIGSFVLDGNTYNYYDRLELLKALAAKTTRAEVTVTFAETAFNVTDVTGAALESGRYYFLTLPGRKASGSEYDVYLRLEDSGRLRPQTSFSVAEFAKNNTIFQPIGGSTAGYNYFRLAVPSRQDNYVGTDLANLVASSTDEYLVPGSDNSSKVNSNTQKLFSTTQLAQSISLHSLQDRR